MSTPAAASLPLSDLFTGPCAGLLLASHEAILMVDEQQRVVALNPAAQSMFRMQGNPALGRPLADFIPARWRDTHCAQVDRFAKSSELQLRMAPDRRVTALRSDGSEIPVEVALSRVDLVVDGQPRHWHAALLRDLSAEHALRDELSVLKRRLYAVIEAAPIAIWIVQDERIEYANRAAAALLGERGGEALRGRRLPELLSASTVSTLRRSLRKAMEPGKSRAVAAGAVAPRLSGQLMHPDGSLRDIELAFANLPDHGHDVIQLVIDDVTVRQRASAELERAGQTLRRLQASVVEAREEERRRISRELHDELGQRLTALKMEVTGLAERAGLAATDDRLLGMMTMLDETVAAVRRIASDLRPLMLDDLGLTAAIEWLARDMARRTGIDIQVALDELQPEPGGRLATAVYRMVQEGLTNVARHAQATRVRIDLHQDDATLVLSVADNGVGLRDDHLTRDDGYGLLGMRERAAMLGGSLLADNRGLDGGARLVVRLPMAASTITSAA